MKFPNRYIQPTTNTIKQLQDIEFCQYIYAIRIVTDFMRPSKMSHFLLNSSDCIQGVSRLEDITAAGDFLGLCDQKSSYKHVSDFGWLQSYGHF
jgi:hypothetical protein